MSTFGDPMTTYYEEFIIHEGVRTPLALYRRDVENNINIDRAYTRDGKWVPTGELATWGLGAGDLDIEEVDDAAANAFIESVKSSYLS